MIFYVWAKFHFIWFSISDFNQGGVVSLGPPPNHLTSMKKPRIVLRKETNRSLSKAMSNIYLKVTIETFSKRRFSGFKKFVTRSVCGELQLEQISLNFKTSCCNLKIKGLGAKLYVAFLLIYF